MFFATPMNFIARRLAPISQGIWILVTMLILTNSPAMINASFLFSKNIVILHEFLSVSLDEIAP